MLSAFFPPRKSCRLWDNLMSKNMAKPDRPQMAIWRHVACWISKATRAQTHSSNRWPTPTPPTHTHTRDTYGFSTATMTRERVSVLRYTYISCLISSTFHFGLPSYMTAVQYVFESTLIRIVLLAFELLVPAARPPPPPPPPNCGLVCYHRCNHTRFCLQRSFWHELSNIYIEVDIMCIKLIIERV
jgi:hypothetical protein